MNISFLGYCFLFLMCILWPVRSYKALRANPMGAPITTPKWKRYSIGITLTLAQTGFAFWTAANNQLRIFGNWNLSASGILATLIFAAITLGTLPWLVRHRSPAWRRRFYSILPATQAERAAWIGICIIVAVGEEVVYRAVVWGLFYKITGDYWTASVIAAAVFALNHLVQGWISIGTIFVIGLGFHLLVLITGGLSGAILGHFLYDFLAGWHFGKKALQELTTPETPCEIPLTAQALPK